MHLQLFYTRTRLLWRQDGEGVRNLLLPGHLVLAVDLGGGGELLALLNEDGAEDVFVAHDGLLVVRVGRAGRAVVAVDWLACL